MIRIVLASLLLLPLAACGGEPRETSTTKLDAVEVQPGTISDSMILLDDAAGDGTAVDTSVPDDGPKAAAKVETDDIQAETDADSPDGEDSVALSGPIASRPGAEEKK